MKIYALKFEKNELTIAGLIPFHVCCELSNVAIYAVLA